jgi:outer membrane protein, multidrug efflux system
MIILNCKHQRWGLIGVGLGLVFLTAGGCKVGPDYTRHDPNMPGQWSEPNLAAGVDPSVLGQWWTTFEDELLVRLIERADTGSLDLQAALARIDQSRALRRYAAGENAPTIDATGSYSRTRVSENGLMVPQLGGSPDQTNLHSAGFDARWEIDMFGRIRRSVESAQAALEQSIEDYRDVRVSLYSEIARNYIEVRTAQARIRYAQANVQIQRKTLELTQSRFNAQIAPQLDVAQAQLNLANTESEIPPLLISEVAALNRLAVFIGEAPQSLRQWIDPPGGLPQVKVTPNAGVPAELLRQRPDIRSAERALAAQTARIGVAQAQLYPSFSLRGVLVLEATELSNMDDWASRAYSFGPGLRWNLFDGNRIRSLVNVEEARTRQLAAVYESTVLRALEEVENAMVGYVQENERVAALERSVVAARQSVEMVETLYKSGLTDFQNVLVTQRALSQQEDRLAISQGSVLQQLIALYKALGGGWEETTDPQTN